MTIRSISFGPSLDCRYRPRNGTDTSHGGGDRHPVDPGGSSRGSRPGVGRRNYRGSGLDRQRLRRTLLMGLGREHQAAGQEAPDNIGMEYHGPTPRRGMPVSSVQRSTTPTYRSAKQGERLRGKDMQRGQGSSHLPEEGPDCGAKRSSLTRGRWRQKEK